MSEGKKPEIFFLMYAEKFLWGTMKAELAVGERAVWIDFLCLAATFEGKVDITYTKKLASMCVVPHELLKKSIKKFVKTKRIKIQHDKKESKIYAVIQKWDLYQTNYLGGKKKARRKLSDAQNAPKKNYAMRIRDIEEKRLDKKRLEERKEEESLRGEEDLSPLPKNLDLKLQDKFREMRAQIRREHKWLELSDEELLKKHRATKDDIKKSIKTRTAEYIEARRVYKD